MVLSTWISFRCEKVALLDDWSVINKLLEAVRFSIKLHEAAMTRFIQREIVRPLLMVLCIAGIATCDSKWSAPHPTPGPKPLGPPGKPIVRLTREKPTFEVTYTEILWDDGRGAVKAKDRIDSLTNAAPKELLDRLTQTRTALDVNGRPYGQRICDARAVVVSLDPDVLIVTVGERKPPKQKGELDEVFEDWDRKDGRWQIVEKALDRSFGYWLGDYWIYAGALVPWSGEMYAFSTDPAVQYQRLKFENDQATVQLPAGRLVLRRRGIDVDVRRE